MRTRFNIYPEALKKLKESGLTERINKLAKKNKLSYHSGLLQQSDIRDFTVELKERKLYEKAPEKELKEYKLKLNEFYQDIDKAKWTAKKHSGEVQEDSDWSDFLLLSGYTASHVLKKSEFWKPKKFGFDTPYALWGTIGAAVMDEGDDFMFRRGHMWNISRNGIDSHTHVTGDMHGDLRIIRTDKTPYETKDPLGNTVQYRPQFDSDTQWLSGYHSCEITMLSIAIRYAAQQKLNAQILSPEGRKKFLAEIKKEGSHLGNFGDAGDNTSRAKHYFMSYDLPMPQLDESNQTKQRSPDFVGTTSNYTYLPYIGHDGSLSFALEEDITNPKKDIRFFIYPEEIDDLIKGLFVQCARGIGRTAVGGMIAGMNYRFSDEYEHHRAEFNKAIKPK